MKLKFFIYPLAFLAGSMLAFCTKETPTPSAATGPANEVSDQGVDSRDVVVGNHILFNTNVEFTANVIVYVRKASDNTLIVPPFIYSGNLPHQFDFASFIDYDYTVTASVTPTPAGGKPKTFDLRLWKDTPTGTCSTGTPGLFAPWQGVVNWPKCF